jgi:U3 small nucleolar RNA-associated protein 21
MATTATTTTTTLTKQQQNTPKLESTEKDGSILFQPHRTIGLISSTQPYSLSKDKSTSHLNTFLTMPLQERFVIYKCDSLKPVLVSNHLPGTKKKKSRSHDDNDDEEEGNTGFTSKGEKMFHAISDSSLDITLTTHAYKGRFYASHATLYKRTKCIDTKEIIRGGNQAIGGSSSSSTWGIVQCLNLGRSKFPVKKGNDDDDDYDGGHEKMENCLLVAMVCARHSFDQKNDGVEVIGHDDEETSDDDDDETSDDDDDDDDDDASKNYHGEVVILIVSRYNIRIHKRIPLNKLPTFTPSVCMHPSAYLNKILIGSTSGEMILLNIRSGKIIHQFKCFQNNNEGERGTTIHGRITTLEQSPAPDTVAVGTICGKVHLVNIRVDVKLFTLHHHVSKKKHLHSKKSNAITSISFRTDASARDYNIAPMAVGQMNGTISVWDLSSNDDDDDDDEDEDGDNDKMTTSRNRGKDLLCQMENAHPGGVCQLNYLPQEPLLISSGKKSNSIVMHIFDNPNHTGRILRQRVGHMSPPELIRYQHSSNGGILASMVDGTDAASCQIFSCGGKGDCSLRLFSTARSVLDREFSQGKGLVKKANDLGLNKSDLYLNEIIGLATSDARTRDWGDMVTIHKDHSMAYVWSTKRKAQSGPVLRQENWNVSAMKVQPPKSTHATVITISSCGNFAVVGTKGGTIYKYNIQSGLPRGSFPRDATDISGKGGKNGQSAGNVVRTAKMLERDFKVQQLHVKEKDANVVRNENRLLAKSLEARHQDAAVVGLAVDTMNKTLVSVGSDSKLILWSFPTHAPHKRSPIHLSSPATKMIHARDSDFLAIALQDCSIIMFDCSSLSVVRKFGTSDNFHRHSGPITDLAFGPDGRKLFTTSLDGSLRVWDVPTSTCVDWMTFASTPTSLALSSTGEFLATSHQGRLGISLWCDKSFFRNIHLGVQSPIEPYQMDEPATMIEEDDGRSLALIATTNYAQKKVQLQNEDSDVSHDLTPKMEGLITLSGLPAAHWKNLFHLELVKERNKPTEAPKKPASAPFFLQWRGGESIIPQVENEGKEENDKDEWEAAWSDEDEGENNDSMVGVQNDKSNKRKQEDVPKSDTSSNSNLVSEKQKRKKINHARSDLVALLTTCSQSSNFTAVTEFLARMGPSAIDVAFSTLCYGMHDLDEGLPLLNMAAQWLLESCESKESFEVINAYLHRFLYIHAGTITGIDLSWREDSAEKKLSEIMVDNEQELNKELRFRLVEAVKKLRIAQQQASEGMVNKLQESLCLLRHFSRII